MRQLGGGLLCVAISPDIASKLKLSYKWDILLQTQSPSLTDLVNTDRNKSQRSTHSITFNHRKLGGATDSQRSNTISNLYQLCDDYSSNNNFYTDFHSMFESPGHLQLLIGSSGLLNSTLVYTVLTLCFLVSLNWLRSLIDNIPLTLLIFTTIPTEPKVLVLAAIASNLALPLEYLLCP